MQYSSHLLLPLLIILTLRFNDSRVFLPDASKLDLGQIVAVVALISLQLIDHLLDMGLEEQSSSLVSQYILRESEHAILLDRIVLWKL